MGYEGDPNCSSRPAFAKDGPFMVFRKLEQAVLPFEDYVDKNYKTIRRDELGDGTFLTHQQRKDLFSARLVGRLKVYVIQHTRLCLCSKLIGKGCFSGLNALSRRFPVYLSREN